MASQKFSSLNHNRRKRIELFSGVNCLIGNYTIQFSLPNDTLHFFLAKYNHGKFALIRCLIRKGGRKEKGKIFTWRLSNMRFPLSHNLLRHLITHTSMEVKSN